MATVGIHYFRSALKCAQRKGKDVNRLLADVGVAKELLEQADARVNGDQMTYLMQLIWTELNDEFMGCTEHPCRQGVFALMARYVLHYETLENILEQVCNFYNLFSHDIQMQLIRRGEITELQVELLRPELDPDHFYIEFWLVIWHRFSSWLIDRKIPLSRVCFTYKKPAHSQELKLLFPCRHSFNRPKLKLCFRTEYLDMSSVRTQRDLSQFLRHSPADLITIPGEERSYKSRIRSLLLHQYSEVLVCPPFELLANEFNFSSQTLRRRLKGEQTSYPQIKDEIRRDLAIEKLVARKLSVAEIASHLGYSEPRSFTRAFKQWTGFSPTAYLQSKR